MIPYWHVVFLAGCQGSQTAAVSPQTTLCREVSEKGTLKNDRQQQTKLQQNKMSMRN